MDVNIIKMKTLIFTLLITSAAFSQKKDIYFLINKNDTLIKKIIFDEKHIGYKIIDEKRKDKYFATNHSYANYD